ncbi:glycosyltransferase family 2 protein [Chishuiella changwenlii]|uniref:glycosyltransferase family 2 protein n=1 Tax=Chishuiella changwenlii TaxID=1434701 RepID=UPI002FDB21A3
MNLTSIVIPVYNVEAFIIKCLESVYQQTYQNIEVILVDDCSPDDSLQVISDYLENKKTYFSTSIVRHEVNKGLSESRNTGTRHAKGDYIYYLDSDDWISNNCIELLLNSAFEYNSDVVIGSTICYLEKDKIEKVIFPLKNAKQFLSTQEEVFDSFIQSQWPVIAPNKLYKKIFLEKNNLKFEPKLLGEDELWSFLWAQYAEKISFVNENTYYYLLRGNSIISSKTKKNFEDMFFMLSKFSEQFNLEKNEKKKQQIKAHILSFKEMILMMQWNSLPNDKAYFYQNYKRLKKYPILSIGDLLLDKFSITQKKKNILLHLPTFIGAPFFIWRYNR